MTEDDVVEKLRLLRNDAGTSIFQRGLKKFNRQRLEVDVSQREKRKTFGWGVYKRLYEKQKGVCWWCEDIMPMMRGQIALDHFDPNSDDFNGPQNISVLHERCNKEKSGKSLSEQAQYLGITITELIKRIKI